MVRVVATYATESFCAEKAAAFLRHYTAIHGSAVTRALECASVQLVSMLYSMLLSYRILA